MNLVLILLSLVAIGFGIYWYFIHIPNYFGYLSENGKQLRKYLAPEELLKLTQNPDENIWIIDVREEEYFALGHIPTSRNFPYDQVDKWYREIPVDKKLILYCDLSLKTQNVINFLEGKGYSQMANWGKYRRWKYAESVDESSVF